MSTVALAHDPAWPRTGGWPAWDPAAGTPVDLAILGIPTADTSLSPTNAEQTPAAIRAALRRYSGHLVAPGAPGARGGEAEWVIDEALRIIDAGDVVGPDTEEGERAATARVAELSARSSLVVALGGDNALTVPAALGVAGDQLSRAGLITVDAHHDLRDGRSNGSPVRRLVEAGLDPRRIVQIGIADFANSRAYRERARELGITVIHRDELHDRPLADVAAEALAVAGAGGGPVHVDLDVDVCDRSVAPGCPASIPGGLQAHELRRLTRLLVADPQVRGVDIAEVDASADAPDGRTVRLAALLVLECAAALAQRSGR
ncbi:arginase family protein [Leucobacter luti]|uniref:Formiminoglutamase n=1 Tax=Leucobacter luti TaxID=340320 RepID=A0A4Q7U0M2_9MICO|nr:arginase family protein [Leucobacter luti]MBL3698518.1 formimidoylglutamase [Leucobacter luti]RZT65892.1 formiminoglutamase [Leucobacter luti]